MKLAMVSEHASPLATLGSVDAGGQNVHVAALARALARAGHFVTVYTRRDDEALGRRVSMMRGVDVVHIDAGPARDLPKDALWAHMPEFSVNLADDWTRDCPDVVHSHFWMSGWAAWRAAESFGVPVVHTYHALGAPKRRHQGSADSSPDERCAVERTLAQRCHAIIATSHEEMFELVRMGAEPAKLSLIPCGVDLDHFRPGDHGSSTIHTRARRERVLVVSRLVERKGIDDAVRAMADLPDAELVIAGGPARPALARDQEALRLSQIARRSGVDGRVRLLGRVDRSALPALYQSADVAVCAPWYEPFGLVALEAMACGLPVVVAAVGGLIDTVLDGVTGIHVPPRRPDLLGEALHTLLSKPALRGELGAAGARRAMARYSWKSVAAETARVYQSARTAQSYRRREVG
jgi:glycosyltransferase involved in cell wall biosynthesis